MFAIYQTHKALANNLIKHEVIIEILPASFKRFEYIVLKYLADSF